MVGPMNAPWTEVPDWEEREEDGRTKVQVSGVLVNFFKS